MKNSYAIITGPKTISIVCRLIIGSIFLLSGLDGFGHFLPPASPSLKGGEFLQALENSGYFYQFLKGLETLCGLALVFNFFVPLTLMVLTPIIVNILLYGIFLDPKTLPVPFIILVCTGYLIWYYRDLFKIIVKYQFYASPDREGKSRIMILDESEDVVEVITPHQTK